MAIIWADGFDHYGTSPNGGRDAMLSGAWADFPGTGTVQVSSSQSRTGTHSLEIGPTTSLAKYARRVIGSARLTVGFALGAYLPELPTNNGSWGIAFLKSGSVNVCSIRIDTDGALRALVGDTANVVVGVSDPIIVAGTWEHIEAKLVVDDIVGSIEVRVNGVTRLVVENIDTGTEGVTQIAVGKLDNPGTGGSKFFDDMVVWDDQGGVNDDFLGVQRVETLFPDSDSSPMDWVASSGSDKYAMVDEVPPDGDTTYILGADTGDKAQFGIEAGLPAETLTVAGIYIPAMVKLVDAGIGTFQVSIVSGGEIEKGPIHPVTTAYTYLGAAFQLNPDGDVPWTKETLEAAEILIEKVL